MKIPGAAAATASVCELVATPSISTCMLVDVLPAISYGTTALIWPGEAYSSGAAVVSKNTFVAVVSELKPEPKILTISPGETAPGMKLPAFTTPVTEPALDVLTRAEFGSAM